MGRFPHWSVGIPGWVNVENAVAAAAVALLHGVEPETVCRAVASFSGVKRRFDIHINTPGIAYVDDYAHHPNEIKAAISSIRNIFPGRTLCGIFQPHLYTRTRDFYKDFADSLSLLDEVILCDIYPAREEPIPGVTSQLIYDALRPGVKKQLIHKEDVLKMVSERDFDVLIVLGAGDLDNYVPQMAEIIEGKAEQ
jgi:UDP-N-acetylmuramate--alanine ligase